MRPVQTHTMPAMCPHRILGRGPRSPLSLLTPLATTMRNLATQSLIQPTLVRNTLSTRKQAIKSLSLLFHTPLAEKRLRASALWYKAQRLAVPRCSSSGRERRGSGIVVGTGLARLMMRAS